MTQPHNSSPHSPPASTTGGGQNIYNARNTKPGKAFSIAEQWQPPALQNALLRLSAMSRPPNTGINIETLRQQLQHRMENILKFEHDRAAGVFHPSSPFKSPKPPTVPKPYDPANGRGTYYPKPPTVPGPSKVKDTDWYAQNAGTRGPTNSGVPIPHFRFED